MREREEKKIRSCNERECMSDFSKFEFEVEHIISLPWILMGESDW